MEKLRYNKIRLFLESLNGREKKYIIKKLKEEERADFSRLPENFYIKIDNKII